MKSHILCYKIYDEMYTSCLKENSTSFSYDEAVSFTSKTIFINIKNPGFFIRGNEHVW